MFVLMPEHQLRHRWIMMAAAAGCGSTTFLGPWMDGCGVYICRRLVDSSTYAWNLQPHV
jgi:hypothetical protein